jgi:tetratricopeptide (TPR) repeat protein
MTARSRAIAAAWLGIVAGAASLIPSTPMAQPPAAEELLRRGTHAYQRGDLRTAVAAFTEAVRIDPGHTQAHYQLCAARYQLDETTRALEDCSRAIGLRPAFTEAYYLRGLLRSQKLGDNHGAVQDFDQAIRLKPDHAAAYLKRGNARARLGDLRSGLADYDRAIGLDPVYADAYFNRGVVRYQLKDVTGALDDLRQAARHHREQGDQSGYERAQAGIRHVETETRR